MLRIEAVDGISWQSVGLLHRSAEADHFHHPAKIAELLERACTSGDIGRQLTAEVELVERLLRHPVDGPADELCRPGDVSPDEPGASLEEAEQRLGRRRHEGAHLAHFAYRGLGILGRELGLIEGKVRPRRVRLDLGPCPRDVDCLSAGSLQPRFFGGAVHPGLVVDQKGRQRIVRRERDPPVPPARVRQHRSHVLVRQRVVRVQRDYSLEGLERAGQPDQIAGFVSAVVGGIS
ncbi:MAG: hypothetical protein ABI647_12920 [Gemmatimonadota bacterium]